MDLPAPINDFLLNFLGSGLILGSLGVVLLPNPIYSAFYYIYELNRMINSEISC